jgi:hypothetical protein
MSKANVMEKSHLFRRFLDSLRLFACDAQAGSIEMTKIIKLFLCYRTITVNELILELRIWKNCAGRYFEETKCIF